MDAGNRNSLQKGKSITRPSSLT